MEYTWNSWDYQSDPEYLKVENEFLKEEHYKLLSDSAELVRLGEMSPDERAERRRAFEQELEERKRQVDEVGLQRHKAEQEYAVTKARLDRDIRAALKDYERIMQEAKTKEEAIEGLNRVAESFSGPIARRVVTEQKAEEKRHHWRNRILGFVAGVGVGLFTSYIYDLVKLPIFHVPR